MRTKQFQMFCPQTRVSWTLSSVAIQLPVPSNISTKKSPFHFLFLYKESDPKNFHVTNDVIGLSTTNLPSPGSVYLEIQLLILVKAVPPSCQSIAANYFWRANCYVVENEYADLGPPFYQRSHPTLQALNAIFKKKNNFRLSLFI